MIYVRYHFAQHSQVDPKYASWPEYDHAIINCAINKDV